MKRTMVLLVALALSGSVRAAHAQGASAAAASELRGLMEQNKLTAVAAIDPAVPDRFVAASLVENLGLLVVGAKSSAGAFLQHAINNRNYGEAYTTLNGTAAPQGKVFVQDAGADGLRPKPATKEGAFDIAYFDVTKELMLNGDWKSQKLDEQEYKAQFKALDEQYAKDLALLVQQAKGGTVHLLTNRR